MLEVLSFFFMFSYVSGRSSFLKPLSAEEEQMYLEEYAKGNEEAKNILIERNMRLVAHIAKKYTNNVGGYVRDSEDIISIGTIGLIKGIVSFDSTKNVRLATYAARCIENEILMFIRASKKYGNEVYLQDPIGNDYEGNEIALIDVIGDENESVVDQIDLSMQIKKLYQKIKTSLLSREKEVIELRYGLYDGREVTQREIADMLGISRSYVSRIEKKALKKLNAEMSK